MCADFTVKGIQKSYMPSNKKQITCICTCWGSPYYFVATSSLDCLITVTNLRAANDLFSEQYTLYGHHREISFLATNNVLQILVSVDLDGEVLIHYLPSGKFLHDILLPIKDEVISQILINENGFIVFRSTGNKIFVTK